ncbi:hypothetical protein [Natronomonas moolapensis]|uniref:hypothetical protein n=1 Tax=Natronomonas moolapensis TaxID=416273 RepID=UPI0006776A3F|nr:hypothetical protein [Natronomonas moolapensis]
MTIGVDPDSEALIALVPNDSVASVIEDSDGELVIDTDRLGADNEGFNVGSTVEIGQIKNGDVADGSGAFKLVSNFDNELDSDGDNFDGKVDIEIDLTDFEALDNSATFELVATPRDGGSPDGSTQTIADGSSEVFSGVDPDDEIDVAIRVETFNSSDPEDITGDVVFRAGSDLANQNFVQQRERDTLTLEPDDALTISQATLEDNSAFSGNGNQLSKAFGENKGEFRVGGYEPEPGYLVINAEFSGGRIDASDLSKSSGGTITSTGSSGLTAIEGIQIPVVSGINGTDQDYTSGDVDALGFLVGPTADGGTGTAYFSNAVNVNGNVQSSRLIPAVIDGADADPDKTESGGGVKQVISELNNENLSRGEVSLDEVSVYIGNSSSSEKSVSSVTVNGQSISLSDLDVTAADNSS